MILDIYFIYMERERRKDSSRKETEEKRLEE